MIEEDLPGIYTLPKISHYNFAADDAKIGRETCLITLQFSSELNKSLKVCLSLSLLHRTHDLSAVLLLYRI
jgi:hypothetical protein